MGPKSKLLLRFCMLLVISEYSQALFGRPTKLPSAQPSMFPSSISISQPSQVPHLLQPTLAPAESTNQPSSVPMPAPTSPPSSPSPTHHIINPSRIPIPAPTPSPTHHIINPSRSPIPAPTSQPSSPSPTHHVINPSRSPIPAPTSPPSSPSPTHQIINPTAPVPTPTAHPTSLPKPTLKPTRHFHPSTDVPTQQPTILEINSPSLIPSVRPTNNGQFPTSLPNFQPSFRPTTYDTFQYSLYVTYATSGNPTSNDKSQLEIMTLNQINIPESDVIFFELSNSTNDNQWLSSFKMLIPLSQIKALDIETPQLFTTYVSNQLSNADYINELTTTIIDIVGVLSIAQDYAIRPTSSPTVFISTEPTSAPTSHPKKTNKKSNNISTSVTTMLLIIFGIVLMSCLSGIVYWLSKHQEKIDEPLLEDDGRRSPNVQNVRSHSNAGTQLYDSQNVNSSSSSSLYSMDRTTSHNANKNSYYSFGKGSFSGSFSTRPSSENKRKQPLLSLDNE